MWRRCEQIGECFGSTRTAFFLHPASQTFLVVYLNTASCLLCMILLLCIKISNPIQSTHLFFLMTVVAFSVLIKYIWRLASALCCHLLGAGCCCKKEEDSELDVKKEV